MELVIPYDENLIKNNGGYINKNGKIFYTYGNHDEFAYNYCNDNDSKKQSMMLTKEELKLYKLWLENYKCASDSTLTDFMVEVLRFDKVVLSNIYNEIITTSTLPHIRFFNYYLMEWNINCIKPMVYNKEKNCLEYIDTTPNSRIAENLDRNAEEKIYYIKKHYSLEDRHSFFI